MGTMLRFETAATIPHISQLLKSIRWADGTGS
ncbi:MAG: hypothetical protein ACI87L_001633 [Litorivivens sp.]|jgi:hypothetical protein